MEANLEKGKYLIFCDVNYRFVYYEIYGYNITIYSKYTKEEFKLEDITNNYNGIKRAEILKFKKGYNIIASHKIKKSEAHKCHILKFEIKENKKNIFINLYQ